MNNSKLIFYRFSFLLLGIFCVNALYSQQSTPKIDWNTDLEFIRTELPKKHINAFSKQSKEYFDSEIELIKQQTDTLSDIQIVLKAQQVIASLGDSHTSLNFPSIMNKEKLLPIKSYWFKNGIYVLDTTKDYEEIIGNKIISFNNTPIETISENISTLLPIDNEATIKKSIPFLMSSLEILNFFNIVSGDSIDLCYETEKGEIKNMIMYPATMSQDNIASIKPEGVSFAYKNQKAFFVDQYFNDDKLYYLQYNICHNRELEAQYGDKEKANQLPSFTEFEARIFNNLETQPIEKIVFDMRFNAGGNSLPGTNFIKKLAEFLKDKNDIKLYVVIGRQTFSSAIINALDFKEMTNAIFIGEETSGKPNHYGEVRSFQLPNSKLGLFYSTKYFKHTDQDLNSITPDIPIEISFSELQKGIDPIFEWIKKQ